VKAFKDYQYLEGEEHSKRSKTEIDSKFWNEGKFENFVKPFIKDTKEQVFIDVGCNKGVFLKEAEDMGFARVIGVDSDKLAVERGRSWAEQHKRNYKIYLKEMEGVLDDLPVADYTVLANTHYYFTINDWLDYIDRLQYKTRYIIIVTAHKQRPNRCWARPDIENIRNYFKTWKEVGFIDTPSFDEDPHPRTQQSICFKSPHIDRVSLETLDLGNHVQKGFYNELDAGKHWSETRYHKIMRPYRVRDHKWPEEKYRIWMEGRVIVYNDVKKNGLKKPVLVDDKNQILDGNHKTGMYKDWGYKSILIRRT